MNTVYTKVVADLFHPGHVNFFRAARALGDRLVVHVVDDERVSRVKRRPVMSQGERMAVVAACRYVDQVTADGPKVITRAFLLRHGYRLYAFACTDDQDRQAKLADCPDLPVDMLAILPHTPGISTTELLRRIRDRRDPP